MASQPLDTSQVPNLWERALASLDDELKSSLDFTRSSKHDILNRTLEIAQQKKQLCINKRWTFERRGRQLILRDLLEKITKCIDHLKKVGDVLIQYDAFHMALP